MTEEERRDRIARIIAALKTLRQDESARRGRGESRQLTKTYTLSFSGTQAARFEEAVVICSTLRGVDEQDAVLMLIALGIRCMECGLEPSDLDPGIAFALLLEGLASQLDDGQEESQFPRRQRPSKEIVH